MGRATQATMPRRSSPSKSTGDDDRRPDECSGEREADLVLDRPHGVVDARVDSRVGDERGGGAEGIAASGAALATPVAKADAEAAWADGNEVGARHRDLAGDRDVVGGAVGSVPAAERL